MAYIYGHYKKDTGELFYIGKGIGRRAWVTSRRNPYWKNVVIKHGYVVKILEDGLTDEQAYEKEKQLIAEVGLENLTNMTEGGCGMTSADAKKILTNNPEWRKKRKEAAVKVSQDPEWREKQSTAVKRVMKTPEWKQKAKEAAKKRTQDPEWKKRQLEGIRRKFQDTEYRKHLSDAAKRRWERRKLMKS